jgi:hypothetical protein
LGKCRLVICIRVSQRAHTCDGAAPQFFQPFDGHYQALWWVPSGDRPSVDLARLWKLEYFGPSFEAFTFKSRFPTPDQLGLAVDMNPEPWCIGHG